VLQTLPYEPLLNITLNHGYFTGKRFKTIGFEPADGTPTLLNNLRMVLRPSVGAIALMASDAELVQLAKSSATPIRLYLTCNDPYHINYTDLPGYDPQKTLVYLNNLPDGKLNDKNTMVGKDDLATVSFGSVTLPKTEGTYLFKDANGEPLPAENARQKTVDSEEYLLSDLPEGLVRIFYGDAEVRKVYYVPKPVWKKPFGVLEIYPAALNHEAVDGAEELEVHFGHPKTFWKYFIVNPKYQKFGNLAITNGAKNEVFHPPQNTTVFDREALVFVSKEAMPLVEDTSGKLKLVNQNESIPELIEKLQGALPNQFFKGENSESTDLLYSHIYV